MNQLARGLKNPLARALNLRQFLVHVARLHEHSEPVVQVAVGANRRRAQRVGGLHGDVEALERHGQRLRPEGVVELELLGVRGGGGEALLLGEPGRAPRVALLLLLLRHGRRLGHRRRGRRPFGRHRRGGGRDRRLLGAPALGPVLLAGASCLRPALLRLVGGLQPLLEVRVPDVLDLVVRPSGQLGGDRGPPVCGQTIQSSSVHSFVKRNRLQVYNDLRGDMHVLCCYLLIS